MACLNAINLSLDDYIKSAGFDKQYNQPEMQEESKNRKITNFYNKNQKFLKRNDNKKNNLNFANVMKTCFEKYNNLERFPKKNNSAFGGPHFGFGGMKAHRAFAKHRPKGNASFRRDYIPKELVSMRNEPAVFNMEKKRLTQMNVNDFAGKFISFLENYENIIHKPVYDFKLQGQVAVIQNKVMQCTHTGVIITTVGRGIDCVLQPAESKTTSLAFRHS